MPGYSVWLRAWQVQVGRVKLYLLDSNDAANFPAHRGITSEFYGGGPELASSRNCSSGSADGDCWRRSASGRKSAISMKGMRPLPCWSAPASFMQETAQPFDVALAVTRAGNLFTTHTAVAAGFDRFPRPLSNNTSADMPRRSSEYPCTIAGPGPPKPG